MKPLEIQSVIETPSLRLRPPHLNDAGRLAKLLNDFEVARMTTSIPHPYGIEDAEQFVCDATPETFVVEHMDHGPIGTVGFSEGEGRRAELGYWIGKPYWGSGYATEAARGAMGWAKSVWNRRHVAARHFVDNPASARVLAKIGFRPTGQVALRSSVARERPALAATHAISLPIADCDNFDGTDGSGETVARPMRRKAA